MTTTDERQAGFRELFGPPRAMTSLVLAGGIALHAVNIFLTTSLLPTAIGEIGGERLYAWSTTVFMIASVISSMLVSRTLALRGPVAAYLIGLAPFVAGAVIAAVSATMTMLLVGRAVQGFGGGMLAGLGYAVVQAAYPERLWARATALVSAMWGVGTLVGPALGGAFAQFDAWRWAFGALALSGVVLAVLVPRALPRSAGGAAREPVPYVSLVLLTVATALISVASLRTDTVEMVVIVAAAALVIGAFVRWERGSAVRVLPASTYAAGSPLKWLYISIAILAIGTVSEAFAPLFGQRLAGLAPLVAGFLGAAVSLGWSVTMVFSAGAERPAAVRRLRIAGPVVLALGLAVTGAFQQEDAGAWLVVVWAIGLIVAGVGIGLAFPHVVVAVMGSSTDPAEAGKASAGVNTVELIGLSIGSAVGGLLLNLGAPSMLASARYLLFGLAVTALVGVLAALRASARSGQPAGDAVE
ncbi:MFS transporter [Jiangella rhizosphaerae]|uniref:MFS transporter n=1 Tax=Jiangella rhizosphaerae TaxID=2293569 RepID=A0A418KIL7_9ACTN|nr:MFS transporter [Jiangella rhizosphaerae]RIQ13297.1 MFS transporter [Jiangella rhizosphaerae]